MVNYISEFIYMKGMCRMLQIKNISKQYKTGELVQNALNDVSLNFRDNEFVSILGPSGSGKTTLLNIIGGLDRYDSGDLIINNVSTKHYKDRDWDSYRNHTIGFVFQSYNLIPHQTVLANVELALTIGGISKKERKMRALDALEQVGLRDQAHKRPNQMSGGQMQRVAIARALVNNPDILLADEPTGALDTETSVQVMELLKEVANDRLVVMVTHNPELAEEYSTRIVRLKDGKIIDDSDPFYVNAKKMLPPRHKNLGKASMSFGTALSLSLNNLMTKKARTILTAFAGSIGIIGIALILSLSTGFHNYINQIQEETLSSYPLTIYEETADMTSALLSMVATEGEEKDSDIVEEQQFMSTMFSSIGSNDLRTFDDYLIENKDKTDEWISMIRYQYSVKPVVYTIDCNDKYAQLNPNNLIATMSGASDTMMALSSASTMSSIFNEMIDDRKLLESEYDVLAGKWPEAYDEAILVLTEPNAIPDLLVYSLGLRDNEELKDMMIDLMAGEAVENNNDPMKFTYEDLMAVPLKVVNASDRYKYNAEYNIYEDMSEDQEFMKDVYEDSLDLKIVGVVCPKKGSNATSLISGVAYTKELTEYVIDEAEKSELVQKQMADRDVNVFSGKRFDDESEEAGLDFQDMITIDEAKLASAFGGNISEKEIADLTQGYMTQISEAITTDTTTAKNDFDATFVTMAVDWANEYVNDHGATIKLSDVPQAVSDYMKTDNCKKLLVNLEANYLVPQDTFAQVYSGLLQGALQGYIAAMGGEQGYVSPEALGTVAQEMLKQEAVSAQTSQLTAGMTEAVMQKTILTKVGELTGTLMKTVGEAFNVDPEAMAEAFQFNLSEEELGRLMETMSAAGVEQNADNNLLTLGYQDMDKPSAISFYFHDFDAKEYFVDFLDKYNEDMEKVDEEKVISYTDITGFLMSSVSTIVDSVTYVLIAFVSISLIVSSIMIGIITYISVLERTKEIGVLRAIGASKKNISSIFNAETFIVGLFSGLIGIGVTLAMVPPINYIIHTVTDNYDINAVLPTAGAVILVILSVVLTLISGLIPSGQAAKKDPVLALRSE